MSTTLLCYCETFSHSAS